MKHILTIVIVLGAIPKIWGAEHFDTGILGIVDEINHQRLHTDYSKLICSGMLGYNSKSSGGYTSTTDSLKACVLSLCGNPSENTQSAFVTNLNYEQFLTKDIKKKIEKLEPLMKKSIELVGASKLKQLADLESHLIENGKLKNLNFNEMSEENKSEISHNIFSPYLDVGVDLKASLNNRVKVKIKKERNIPADVFLNLKNYAVDYENYLKKNTDKFQELGLYSEDEMDQVEKNRKTEAITAFNSNRALFSKEEQDDLEFKLKRLGAYEKIEGQYMIFFALGEVERALSNHILKFKAQLDQPTCSDPKGCNKIFEDYLNNLQIEKKLSDIKKDLLDPNIKEQSINRCKAQVVAQMETQSDLDTATKLVNATKVKMDQDVFDKFSAHSKKILQDYFKDNINVNSTNPNTIFAQKDPVVAFEDRADRFLNNDLVGNASSTKKSPIAELLEMSKYSDENDLFADIDSPCPSIVLGNAWDKYLPLGNASSKTKELFSKFPPKDTLFISSSTCHHDLRGKAVVAHELGHAINQIFKTMKLSTESTKFYKQLRQCATDNYVHFVADKTFYSTEGDGLETEEDTADLFSYMTYQNEDDYFSCALLKPSPSGKTYDDLAFLLDNDDTHSTATYRLIMEAINKGRNLPISCQKAILENKDKLRFKKCIP